MLKKYSGIPTMYFKEKDHRNSILIGRIAIHKIRFENTRNLITPIRVPADVEKEGLDIPEMGAHGYPDFSMVPN